MRPSPEPGAADREEEITALLRTLQATQQRLQELAGGEVDAVLLPDGQSYLLHDAQEKLQESEHQQRGLIAQLKIEHERLVSAQAVAKVGSWETDLATLKVIWSAETYRIFETSPAEFRPTHEGFLNFVPEEDRKKVNEAFERSLGRGEPSEIEHRIQMPDGRIKYVEERWQAITDEQGEPVRALGTCRDITEHRAAERALRESEERFRGTFEQAAVGMAHVALGGNFQRVNDRLCEITGYSREELMGLTFADLTMPEDLDESEEAREAMLAGELPAYRVEKRYRRRDGDIIWVNLVTTLERSADGDPKYFISVFVDITPRKQAEENLTASEALLRQFIEHTPAAIAMLDREMRYIQASERWIEEYHLKGRTIVGLSHYDIFPDLPHRWKEIHQRVLAGAVERCEEDCFTRADGSIEWLQWEAFPWRKAGGEIGGLIFFTQVITARKQAELQTRFNEQRYRSLVETTSSIVWDTPASGKFEADQPGWSAFTGQTFEELRGWGWLNAIHPEDRARTSKVWSDAVERRSPYEIEHRLCARDGTYREMMVRAVPILGDDQSILQWIGVHTDITERKRAEAATSELAERLQLAVKASKVGIWDWDITKGSMHWDDQMYALYQASAGTAQGVELWQQQLHPDDSARATAEITEALRLNGKPFDTSFRIVVAPDGEIRHIRALGVVFRDAEGHPTRMLGTNWDVTDQVAREHILQQKLENETLLLQRALAGEKAKSDFLAVMSHEIRTPMNGVLGFAEMLAQSPNLTPEDRELSHTIFSSGQTLLRILDDILDFSRIEAGRLAIVTDIFSPRKLVGSIEELFRRQIEEKGLRFLVTLNKNVPASLPGDAGRIRQILVNLLGNALKFTRQGSIALRANASFPPGGEGWLEFTVQDTGDGISSDKADTVFEPFTQEDSSTSRHHGGTGLGLTISRRLAKLMGGDLQMSNTDEGGATFTVRLPFQASDLLVAPAAKDAQPVSQLDSAFAHRHPLRVLVVEDDKVNLKLIMGLLGKLGYEPLSAHNGVEAVDLNAREKPDCVLMDIQMPGLDGIEATRQIRAFETDQALPRAFISALTANILPEHREQCLKAGMNAYLNKPVNGQQIMTTLLEAWKFRSSPPI
ncbi:hypothetical protein BH09VER1_BH09VER1_01690 [soil metagenome]